MFITVKNHLSLMITRSDNHDKRGIIRKHPLPSSITAADFTVSNNPLFERKLELATEGLEPSFVNKLKTAVSNDNALVIANYIIAMKTEINPSDKYRINNIQTLAKLSQFFKNQISFKQMTRDNILLFLDSYRKTDAQDSMHHWIGSYNLLLVILIRFFKCIRISKKKAKEFSSLLVTSFLQSLVEISSTWESQLRIGLLWMNMNLFCISNIHTRITNTNYQEKIFNCINCQHISKR